MTKRVNTPRQTLLPDDNIYIHCGIGSLLVFPLKFQPLKTDTVNIGDTELECRDAHTRISFHTPGIIIRPLKQAGKYGCEVDRRKTVVRS